MEGFEWLGLDWDHSDVDQGQPGSHGPATEPRHLMRYHGDPAKSEPGVVYQSIRGFAYITAVHAMGDHIYPCFCTPEETKALQEKCRADGKRFSCPCRTLGADKPWSKSFCSRFDVLKAFGSEAGGDLTVDDLILGPVTRNVNDISDPVLLRTDGGVVYGLACVVDDYEMGITHVIRGQEHLTNTFLQLLLYKALGWKPPQFAHIPFICAPPPSTKKLSKRDALDLGIPITLEQYRQEGYLADALFNYLSHLGWAMDATREKWSKEEFVAAFGFDGTVKKPAHFDLPKCLWLNSEYLKEMPVEQRTKLVIQFLGEDSGSEDCMLQIVAACGDRLTKLSDIYQHRHFWVDAAFQLDPKAVEKRLVKDDGWKLLKDFTDDYLIDDLLSWKADALHEEVNAWTGVRNLKPATLIHALRVATTGSLVGFGVFEGMEILGKDRTLSRIRTALDILALQQK